MRVLPALMLVWSASACDKFCDFEDCGSCGNACCKLSYYVNGLSTEEVVKMLNKTLGAGGPDGHYAQVMTYEGTLGFADLRPFDKPVHFIGQAVHTTTGKARFNDTLDFTIAPTSTGSLVTAFSISQIAGAYCDSGQNFSNLQMLFASLGLDMFVRNADASCAMDSWYLHLTS
uniref:Uncharacterized protein n=1 Tax=Pinguiococcus pyrenoidosus TaxID=172671 RepID=A0A7R9UEN9_9STRA|mmetsp:Transcript_7111/g.27244  ORF Transcript_7111/g.27244 Transcript_7111/m.27244 type:complete len:173 (+) Transcript_7111:73-591(+)